jgi:hypothetical protein
MHVKGTGTLVFFLLSGAIFAQTEKATLRGIVTDPSGAVVVNATVVVTEVATNVEARRVATDENGNYEVPDLRPTTYRIQMEAPGFRRFIADAVVLDPGQFRRVDARLAVGTATEAITVEAGAALIQTEGGTISGLIDAKLKYPDVPTVDVYPSPLAMLVTTPSIQGNGWNLPASPTATSRRGRWMVWPTTPPPIRTTTRISSRPSR